MKEAIDKLQGETTSREETIAGLQTRRDKTREQLVDGQQVHGRLQSEIAAHRAQIDLLESAENSDNTTGTQAIMDSSNPLGIDQSCLLGAIAGQLQADPEYRIALQAVLHSWADAVIVSNAAAAADIISKLEAAQQGSIHLLAADSIAAAPNVDGPGARLLQHVKYPDTIAPLVQTMLQNVFVVDATDAIPAPTAQHGVYVTRDGVVTSNSSVVEFWTTDTNQDNPLSRKRKVAELLDDLAKLNALFTQQTALMATQQEALTAVTGELEKEHASLQQHKHDQAVKQGENQMIEQGAAQASERFETVTWELKDVDEQAGTEVDRKQDAMKQMDEIAQRRGKIKANIETKSTEVRRSDQKLSHLSSEAMEAKLRCSQASNKAELLDTQLAPMRTRVAQLEEIIETKTRGLSSRTTNIDALENAVKSDSARIAEMENAVAKITATLTQSRQQRQQSEVDLGESDKHLVRKRTQSDELRDSKSALEIKHAESRMERRNILDRITSEYSMTAEAFQKEPEPEWEEGEKLEGEDRDTRIAELRTKLDAMGAVNLVAIEEHQELEDRYEFLNAQHNDLIEARQKLLKMISKINETTSVMFSETFAQVNENFDKMFKSLFNGGSAKLVLVDEEDVLECGIEIIARPPGKKLQNVSLLSGGERTMTAVSLLFAIYMIKSSPFCVLDELDAPLDDSNIGRFIKILQGFLDRSQFLIITHNQQTIAAADTLYGVTMEEKGCSKVVSMKFVSGRPQTENADEQPVVVE